MEQIVGVRFKPAGKIYYFDGNDLELHLDDGVIVETSRGLEYGYVVTMPTEAEKDEENPMKPVIRRATIKDMAQLERNKAREKSAFDICLQKIEKFKVPMKLLRAEYTFDRNKIVFFFTSDGRVDFRELVKELAAVFHTRIELRQVGVRDEAKQVSGIGSCGVCGRLMCCLRYENDQYSGDNSRRKKCCAMQQKGKQFRVGMKVITDEGMGQVLYVNSQKHTVKVQLDGQKTKTLSWDVVEQVEND